MSKPELVGSIPSLLAQGRGIRDGGAQHEEEGPGGAGQGGVGVS